MITLKAEKREVFGKKVRQLRKQGFIPAELYGRGIPNLHLSLPVKELESVYLKGGEHTVINLEIGKEARTALIHDLYRNAVSREILAVDFYQVKMDEKTKAHVPIVFIGESPAVKSLGGILVKAMDEIEVEALPADLPSEIPVDLSHLFEFDQSIYVKDLPKGDRFEFLVDSETVVVSVTAPREEEPEEVVVAEAVEGTESPEASGATKETSDETAA